MVSSLLMMTLYSNRVSNDLSRRRSKDGQFCKPREMITVFRDLAILLVVTLSPDGAFEEPSIASLQEGVTFYRPFQMAREKIKTSYSF